MERAPSVFQSTEVADGGGWPFDDERSGCLNGDDIAGQQLDLGFASDEQAASDALCVE